ncbi:MAG: XdhC family protein [Deltaproteobacteria bacterium]|nr:XdhC family protein [Deltaproteobacteria bacterium]
MASALLALLDRGEAAALATVIRTAGSTPQVVGARLLLAPDGTTVGTVGGGRIEETVIAAMRETLADGKPRRISRHLARDLGMCCGGEMEVFVERIEGRPALLLFGAGHVAKPTAALAERVGFEVTVVDDREELLTPERFPDARRVLADPAEAVRAGMLPFGPSAYVIVCTHDHRLDEEALAACLDRPRAYLGMIGSRRKVLQIARRIRSRRPDAPLGGIAAPIGLDLGAETPDEIAVSIVAELIATKHGRSGGAMRLDLAKQELDHDDGAEEAS